MSNARSYLFLLAAVEKGLDCVCCSRFLEIASHRFGMVDDAQVESMAKRVLIDTVQHVDDIPVRFSFPHVTSPHWVCAVHSLIDCAAQVGEIGRRACGEECAADCGGQRCCTCAS